MNEKITFSNLANFQPKQLEAYKTLFRDDCKYLLYGGAAAGGKSYFIRWATLALGMYYAAKYQTKGIPIGLFSEDYPTLKDRQISRIKREFPAYLGELKETKEEGYVFKARDKWGGFNILLRNLDDPSKYASVEFAAILVEELTKNIEETFDDLRFRLRYPGISDPKFVGATNPGSIGHGWVRKKWISPIQGQEDIEQKNFFYIPAKYSDNHYIDESYVNQLKALPERKRLAFMEGSWDIFEGQFFTEFNRNVHVIPRQSIKKGIPIIGSLDWGYTAPFSFHLTAYFTLTLNGVKFNRAVTFKEITGTQNDPQEVARKIKETGYLQRISKIYADPSIFNKGQDGSISIAKRMLEVLGDDYYYKLVKANNDRVNRWGIMHNWLSLAPDSTDAKQYPYWLITEECPYLIRTIPEMVHDEHNIEDIDTRLDDHAVDDVSYGLQYIPWIDARSQIYAPQTQNPYKDIMTDEAYDLFKDIRFAGDKSKDYKNA